MTAFREAPDLIVASSFVRAKQTAVPTRLRFVESAYEEWPVEEFTYLGDLGGASTVEERRPLARRFWDGADPDFRFEGGESFSDLFGRATKCLDDLSAREGFVAVFTHGLFMRAVVWSVLSGVSVPEKADLERFRLFVRNFVTPNGCIVELSLGERRLVRAGSTAHLPAEMVTGGE
ncbi:hypothetical protein GCM10027589_25840 [Actinocorallia lasiicapitis]